MKVTKAVIPVAGLGTRFLPASKVVAKELFPIVDRPTIHYIVEEAWRSGIRHIVFVTASGKGAIEDYFDIDNGLEAFLEKKGDLERLQTIREISRAVEVHSVRQKQALGLGHAILSARNFIGDEPFAVLLGDDMIDAEVPATKQMVDVADKHNSPVIAAFRVPMDKAERYGIIDPDPKPVAERLWKIRRMVEKPKGHAPSNIAIIGRYILPARIFEILANTQPGLAGEIQLTDALIKLNQEEGILAYEFEGDRYDAGDIYGFIQANLIYGLKRKELRPRLLELIRKLGQ
ncbi:MAG TPA: UTP--glucose-1-phosphate uridylyltransferase [bacterium]|nr:UTP--glucose-1-phosphate uridylyltransferase [bacterium]